jgi:hypothetical protein
MMPAKKGSSLQWNRIQLIHLEPEIRQSPTSVPVPGMYIPCDSVAPYPFSVLNKKPQDSSNKLFLSFLF